MKRKENRRRKAFEMMTLNEIQEWEFDDVAATAGLTDQERLVMMLAYGRHGLEPRPLTEVSEVLEWSYQRVQRRCDSAWVKMRRRAQRRGINYEKISV